MTLQFLFWLCTVLFVYPISGGIFLRLVELSQAEITFTEREKIIIVSLWPLWLVFLIGLSVLVFSVQFGIRAGTRLINLTSKKSKTRQN